ncbi:hypothetical protein [Streptomyces sp. NPDC051211]|uniref:hypothetical protein n=1 Tax=Streptomyces sp. NPDC051211 TaxID=3154643 RepID=UPI00344ECB36
MSPKSRSRQRQSVPSWVSEGARIFDPLEDRQGIVQFIGEWENPTTRTVVANAVFARPEGGGREWIVQDPRRLERG